MSPKKSRKIRNRKQRQKLRWIPIRWRVFLIGVILVLFSPLYYGYVLKVMVGSWRWLRDLGQDPNYPQYNSFAIRIPKNYSIHGIDVSSYQGKIDWAKAKMMQEREVKLSFAFIKATEGLLLVDPYFQRNWREAPKVGLVCGAYHFFRPSTPGKAQAKFFLQVASVEAGDLPPVVDVERLDGVTDEKLKAELADFLNYVELKTSVRPIIYTGLQFYQQYLSSGFEAYPFWIAHYHQPKLKLSGTKWKFWQHSDRAKINGINHVVDFNTFNGDSTAFKKMIIKMKNQ